MVTDSKIRGFVVVSEVRFIEFVDSEGSEKFSYVLRLKKDVVVKTGVPNVRFVRQLEYPSH